MANSVFEKLLEVLQQEAEAYESVLELSRKKTGVIVEGNVPELEKITKTEQSLILKIKKLENAREEQIKELSEQFGADRSSLTVTRLKEYLSEEDAEKLVAWRERISRVLGELSSSNELNLKLIRNSLEYIDFSINLLAAAEGMTNNYGKLGKVERSKSRNFLDVKL